MVRDSQLNKLAVAVPIGHQLHKPHGNPPFLLSHQSVIYSVSPVSQKTDGYPHCAGTSAAAENYLTERNQKAKIAIRTNF
jgi:hypothetical protein